MSDENIDLRSVDIVGHSEAGTEVTILHPVTGKRLGTIRVTGIWAPAIREATLKARKRNADDDATMSRLLADATLGWEGFKEDGVEIKFSKAAAYDLYMRYPVVRRQVIAAATDEGNFLTG